MKNFFKLFFLFFFGAFVANAQELRFENRRYDFGRIEGLQDLEYAFVFKNTSQKTVTIQKIEPDCACSTVSYGFKPIFPNQTDTIRLKYMPYRAGAFSKSFSIFTDGDTRKYTLVISGFIAPNTPDMIGLEFQHTNKRLKFRHKNLNFGTLDAETVVSKKFQFFNYTDQDVVFTDRIVVPEHLKVYFDSSNVVRAKSKGAIIITYDPKLKAKSGYLQDHIVMFTNDTINTRLTMSVAAFIDSDKHEPEVNLSQRTETEQKIEGAKLRISERKQELGKIYPDMAVYTEFVIFNDGNQALQIQNIVGEENCEILSETKGEIMPYESMIVKVAFKQNGSMGKQSRRFAIYSDDPDEKVLLAELDAEVVNEEE